MGVGCGCMIMGVLSILFRFSNDGNQQFCKVSGNFKEAIFPETLHPRSG